MGSASPKHSTTTPLRRSPLATTSNRTPWPPPASRTASTSPQHYEPHSPTGPLLARLDLVVHVQRPRAADLARAAAHTMEQSRRMGQMFAHAAVESSDPATMAAGLTLADRVNDPGQDSVSDRDEYEDMPSGDLTEIMRAHALAGLASALEACGSVLDAAYRVEAIGRERGVDLFPARGYVTDFVADAMKCLRAARALAKEDSDA